MPRKTSYLTADQKTMEDFFKKNLSKFFPEARKFKKLEMDRHRTIAREDFIMQYKLFFVDKNNRIKLKSLRGAARDNNSKYYNQKIITLLWNNNFKKGNYGVPRPLGYNSYLNQSLYEECPGETLYQCIEKNENLKINFKKSACWLAKLHQLKIKRGVRTNSLKKEKIQVEKMDKTFSEIVLRYPPFKINFTEILQKFWEIEKTCLKSKDFILIHNDFNPGNIIIGKKKTCCIDFVDSCRFHPLADVGTLLAYINSPLSPLAYKYKFSSKAIGLFEEIFVREYCRNLKLDSENIKKQLALFKVRALLIMAMHLTKLSLGWGKNNNYKWKDEPITYSNKIKPVKIYDYFNNPRFIILILHKVKNFLDELGSI